MQLKCSWSHVRRVPRTRNLPEEQEHARLLLLEPKYINLDVSELAKALALDYTNRSACIHAILAFMLGRPKSHNRVNIPSPSVEARTTAYNSDSPDYLAMTDCVFE